MPVKNVDLSEVTVRKRFRKEFGDLSELAASIEAIGLLHPIVVDSACRLVAGERRFRAVKSLGWDKIPVNIVKGLDEAAAAIKAESDENTCRKELLMSERVALGQRLEALEKPKAKERQKRKPADAVVKKNNHKKDNTKLADAKVGKEIGVSHVTYRKAKEVIASGDTEAIEQMDRTGKVGPAHNRVKQKQKQAEIEQKAKEVEHLNEQPEWTLICGDTVKTLKSLDEQSYARLIFADPPYNIGIDYGKGKASDQLDDDQYLRFCSNWMQGCWDNLSDDGSFWLLVSDDYAAELCVAAKRVGFHLRRWLKWFEGFGVNCSNNFNRTTRHIFWFVADPKNFVFHSQEVMRPSDRQTKYNDKRASSGGKIENDLWDIPRLTGTCKERMPQFPTQIPIAIVDRIVRCASDPGDLVIDPFNGSGTTGVAALQNRRKYIGIDASQEFIDLADLRLKGVRCDV